jgi:hypothetical protein
VAGEDAPPPFGILIHFGGVAGQHGGHAVVPGDRIPDASGLTMNYLAGKLLP